MVDFVKQPVATPAPVPKPEYVYEGEKNYEPPKADPWVEGDKK